MKNTDIISNNEKRKKLSPKSIVSLIFIILFSLIIFSFPVMYLCGVSAGKNYENKVLSEAPKLDELITNYTGFADDFDDYFNDHFPLKSHLISLYSFPEYKLFKNSILPNTTSIGKDGWLFFEGDNTRSAVSGQRMLSETQLEKIYNGIMEKYQILSDLGKKYVIYLAAEKQTIYPEYDNLYHADYTLINQLIEYLNEKNCPVPFIYSKDYLLTKKTANNQLYFKYDTHWNHLGAYYGYQSVMNVVKPMFENKLVPVASDFTLTTKQSSGDLAKTIFLSDYLKEPTPVPVYKYKHTVTNSGGVSVVTSSVESDIKIFIYGDSFAQANYWGAPFSQTSSETRILHNSKGFQKLLDNLGESDIVIEECVQRVPSSLGRVFF